jgi:hypothetical protein
MSRLGLNRVGFQFLVIVSELHFTPVPMTVMRPFILVDQPAEDLAASYPRHRQIGDWACDAGVVVGWPKGSWPGAADAG